MSVNHRQGRTLLWLRLMGLLWPAIPFAYRVTTQASITQRKYHSWDSTLTHQLGRWLLGQHLTPPTRRCWHYAWLSWSPDRQLGYHMADDSAASRSNSQHPPIPHIQIPTGSSTKSSIRLDLNALVPILSRWPSPPSTQSLLQVGRSVTGFGYSTQHNAWPGETCESTWKPKCDQLGAGDDIILGCTDRALCPLHSDCFCMSWLHNPISTQPPDRLIRRGQRMIHLCHFPHSGCTPFYHETCL